MLPSFIFKKATFILSQTSTWCTKTNLAIKASFHSCLPLSFVAVPPLQLSHRFKASTLLSVIFGAGSFAPGISYSVKMQKKFCCASMSSEANQNKHWNNPRASLAWPRLSQNSVHYVIMQRDHWGSGSDANEVCTCHYIGRFIAGLSWKRVT